MATTFSLRLPRPPTRAELADLLAEPDVVGLDTLPEAWPEGTFAHLHVPGESTRGLEIGPEAGMFTVRALSCSAPEELAMAVRLVVGLARQHGVTLQRDGSGDLDADAFAEAFGPAWIAATVEQDFANARALGADRPLTMPGPTRNVSIGPATLARVGPGSAPLLRVMRDVLYPNGLAPDDEGELYVSKGIRIAREGREIVVHAIAPGVDYFLSGGDVYAIIDEPIVHVPVAALPGLAPDHVTPVDDASVQLRGLTGDAWTEFVDRARAIGTADPFAAAPPPARAARPAGTLLPLLRPPTWRTRDAVATRTLLESPRPIDHLPLVTIVVDTPTSTASMPKEGWPEPETSTFALAEAAAVANLAQLDLPFQEDREEGRLVGLTVLGEYAAELLLSKHRLDEVHAKLGELVVAAAPVRGIVRFRRGDDIQATGTLIGWAQYCFEDAGRRPNAQPGLTPLCFGVLEGRVQAIVQARGPDENGDIAEDEPTEDGGGALQRAAEAARSVPNAHAELSNLTTPATAPGASRPTPAPAAEPATEPAGGPPAAGVRPATIVGGIVVAGLLALAVYFLMR